MIVKKRMTKKLTGGGIKSKLRQVKNFFRNRLRRKTKRESGSSISGRTKRESGSSSSTASILTSSSSRNSGVHSLGPNHPKSRFQLVGKSDISRSASSATISDFLDNNTAQKKIENILQMKNQKFYTQKRKERSPLLAMFSQNNQHKEETVTKFIASNSSSRQHERNEGGKEGGYEELMEKLRETYKQTPNMTITDYIKKNLYLGAQLSVTLTPRMIRRFKDDLEAYQEYDAGIPVTEV